MVPKFLWNSTFFSTSFCTLFYRFAKMRCDNTSRWTSGLWGVPSCSYNAQYDKCGNSCGHHWLWLFPWERGTSKGSFFYTIMMAYWFQLWFLKLWSWVQTQARTSAIFEMYVRNYTPCFVQFCPLFTSWNVFVLVLT